MNFNEFSKAFLEYFDEKGSNRKLIACIEDGDSDNVLLATRCTQKEAMQMIFIIARKCGITLKELAYMCIAIDSDKDASRALEDLIKESSKEERLKKAIASVEKAKSTLDADKNSDESQEKDDSDDGKIPDDTADVISAVLMDVLKLLDD